jgi:hypothetical protein
MRRVVLSTVVVILVGACSAAPAPPSSPASSAPAPSQAAASTVAAPSGPPSPSGQASAQPSSSAAPSPSASAGPSLPPSPITSASVRADLKAFAARPWSLSKVQAAYGAVPSAGGLQAEAASLGQDPAWDAAALPAEPGSALAGISRLVGRCTAKTSTSDVMAEDQQMMGCAGGMRYAVAAAEGTRTPEAIAFARGLVAYALAVQIKNPNHDYIDNYVILFR